MSSGDVMQTTQGRVGSFKVPVALAENASVGPGRNHFTDKQVVGLLVVRLGDQLAGQPGRASLNKGQVMARHLEQWHRAMLEFLRVISQADAADLTGQLDLGYGRYLDHKYAAVFHQLAGFHVFIQNHGQFGRGKVQCACPCRCHDILHPGMAGRDQNRRAVVKQSVGFVQRDCCNVLRHGGSAIGL